MMPVIAHVARISHGEGRSRAIEPGTMKTPTPMVVPMTIQMESNRLNRRGNSRSKSKPRNPRIVRE
jgi:hypothetical protein